MLIPALGAVLTLLGCHDLTSPEHLLTGEPAQLALTPPGTVVVWSGSLHGWSFLNDDTGGACGDATRCRFVVGPATPPLGGGSAELAATVTADATLELDDYAGVRLDHVTALRYSTYRQSADAGLNAAVTLQLNVDYDLTDALTPDQGRLVYEPSRTTPNGVAQGSWQAWDARAGKWWGTDASVPVAGRMTTNPCVEATPCTWTQLIARFPNIGIHALGGGIILKALNGDDFRGNVDNLVVGVDGSTTTFDFDTQESSFPATFPGPIPPALWDTLLASANILVNPPGITGRVVRDLVDVVFTDSATQAMMADAVRSVNGRVIGGALDNVYEVRIPYVLAPGDSSSGPLLRAIATLRANPAVEFAVKVNLDVPVTKYRRPQFGPGYTQWPLSPDSAAVGSNNWNLVASGAPYAWGCATGSVTAGDPLPLLAVVDDGLFGITDLNANLGTTRELTDGTRPLDGGDHGTKVVSVIAAVGHPQSGITGMMWRANVDLFNHFPKTTKPEVLNDQLDAIRRAMRSGARIINISMGLTPDSTPTPFQQANANDVGLQFRNAVRQVLRKSPSLTMPLFVISAGNEQSDAIANGYATAASLFPEIRSHMIIVAATQLSSSGAQVFWSAKSNSGFVDIAAPGAAVSALDRYGVRQTVSGTSFAAPMVTGVAGLLLSFDPRIPADTLRQLILAGANQNPQRAVANRKSPGSTIPVLNAYESLRLAATRSGAPVCGNRIWWGNGNALVVERRPLAGPVVDDTIARFGPPNFPSLSTLFRRRFHEGHRIDISVSDSASVDKSVVFRGGHWVTDVLQPLPADSGVQMFPSFLGGSHDGDSIIVVHGSLVGDKRAYTFGLALSTQGEPTSMLVPQTIGELKGTAYPVVGHEMLYLHGTQQYADETVALRGVDTRTGAIRTLTTFILNTPSPGMSMSEDGKEVVILQSVPFDASGGRCVIDFRSTATGALLRRVISEQDASACYYQGAHSADRLVTWPKLP